MSGITTEEDVLHSKDDLAPLFYADSVADLKDIFVFAEDMTNEDEEKQALAELERLKQERRERKRKQREERRKIKEQREREIEEGKQMMREELERMEREEREKAEKGDANHDTKNDANHSDKDNAKHDNTDNPNSQPSSHNETTTQETLVTEEDLKK